jgi:hypothetical protein
MISSDRQSISTIEYPEEDFEPMPEATNREEI